MVGFAGAPPPPAGQPGQPVPQGQPAQPGVKNANLAVNPKGAQQKPKQKDKLGSRPIPGESLTAKPGNMPWEKPPQFSDVDKALEFVWDQMHERNHALKLIALLDKGIPVDGLVNGILQSGFAAGKWTVDMKILMVKPVIGMVLSFADAAGLTDKIKLRTRKKSKSAEELENIITMKTGAA